MDRVVDWTRRHLLGIKDLTPKEIMTVLDTARSFGSVMERAIKKVPTLRGVSIANLFFEPSTRTRISFELAAKRLSADVINIAINTSSVVKGETLIDTIKTIRALYTDIVVIRHPYAGAAECVAKNIEDICVVNAGDGANEHPSQALLDMYTIYNVFGGFEGLNVLIVGDILHSRVARSNIWGLTKMKANVSVCGPITMLPRGIEDTGVSAVYTDLDEAVKGKDVVMFLRLQKERQQTGCFPTIREYHRLYGLTADRAKRLKKKAVIMHPGPVNRGVELEPSVADGENSLILDQVSNGVLVRMAIFYLISSQLNKPSGE